MEKIDEIHLRLARSFHVPLESSAPSFSSAMVAWAGAQRKQETTQYRAKLSKEFREFSEARRRREAERIRLAKEQAEAAERRKKEEENLRKEVEKIQQKQLEDDIKRQALERGGMNARDENDDDNSSDYEEDFMGDSFL